MMLVHVHTLLGIEKNLVPVVVPDDPDFRPESKRHNTTDCYFVVSGFIDATVT